MTLLPTHCSLFSAGIGHLFVKLMGKLRLPSKPMGLKSCLTRYLLVKLLFTALLVVLFDPRYRE